MLNAAEIIEISRIHFGLVEALPCPKMYEFDHLIDVNGEDLMEPTVNICVGIRWLFHKRKLAEAKLGGDVSWDETVIFYKVYRNKLADELARKMLPFRTFMEKLEKCQ